MGTLLSWIGSTGFSIRPVRWDRADHWRFNAAVAIAAVLMSMGLTAQCAATESMHGIYALGDPLRPVAPRIVNIPSVDGLALRYFWDGLEPSDGVFDWSRIDRDIALASSRRKEVSLSITAGIHSPAWIYAAGAAGFKFSGRIAGPSHCGEQEVPVPWDPVFLAKWDAFVSALGSRYGSNPAVAGVKITGINSITQETMLPHNKGGLGAGGGAGCPVSDDVANWARAGYTDDALLRAWSTIAGTFARSFPDKQLAVMLVPGGLPSVSESALSFGRRRGKNSEVVRDIVARGIQSWGPRFVVQNNALSAFWSWSDMEEIAHQTPIGYQMLWRATGDPDCRMNHGISPCDPRQVMEQAIGRGIGSGAAYLEIYIPDILNPELQQVIAGAHSRLTRRGPQ